MYRCENCHIEIPCFRDKVNNNFVCFECMTFAIEKGVRFLSDFEKVTKQRG